METRKEMPPKDGPGPRGVPDCYYTSRVLDSTARYVRFVRKLRALEEEQRKGNETKHKELTDKHSKCVHVLPCIVKLRAKECEEVQLYQMKEKAARLARHAAEAKLIGDTWDSLAGQGLAAQLAKEELRKRKELKQRLAEQDDYHRQLFGQLQQLAAHKDVLMTNKPVSSNVPPGLFSCRKVIITLPMTLRLIGGDSLFFLKRSIKACRLLNELQLFRSTSKQHSKMYSKAFLVLALAAVALGHDIIEGSNNTDAKEVFHDHFEASPAIWKQTKDLFINASENEVISKIIITDLRPDKDGDAQITAGGVGQNNVTITLKSPTILRGYDFLVSVFSVCCQNVTVHENNSNSQFPDNVGGENQEIPDEKVHTEIPRDVATGKTDVFTESGLATVTGKPVQVSDKSTEVTDTTATLSGDITTPKTKEFREPDSTEALGNVPEEIPVHVQEQEPKNVQPFQIRFNPPRTSTTKRY
ncbi:hypothetical protein MSG28_012806 [Choristoneura fumiferana]|uniref:Uncharacterized protein n=1 Tax=Choristoneura fumiferana TaxID=7141 RepID=A0ACC0JI19_CHOFU|nr:hypothetical protein MSG28_012806 [Choristoneura fumiferana]